MQKNLIKGIRAFIIISIISVGVILFLTVDKNTLYAIRNIKPVYFVPVLFVVFLKYLLECVVLYLLTWAFGRTVSFRTCIDFIMGGAFLSVIPSGLAGFPYQIYLLKKDRYTVGKATALVAWRALLYLFGYLLFLPFMLQIYKKLGGAVVPLYLLRYIFVIIGIIVLIGVLATLKSDITKKFGRKWIDRLKEKNHEKLAKFLKSLLDEIDHFRYGIRECIAHGVYRVFIAYIAVIGALILQALLAPTIFYAIGVKVPFIKTAIIQILVTCLMLFSPSPGGSGIAEGLGYFLFRYVCDCKEILGVFVIIWRVIGKYIPVGVGAWVLARFLKETKAK